VTILPFYGADDPELFAIERRAMDRDGLVIAALDRVLSPGDVLDVGAGDGFTARLLAGPRRRITCLEPARAMMRSGGDPRWVQGEAERLPFADGSFACAYATWAYFFSRDWDPRPGVAELDRVVRPGGMLAIVENLGGDAFTALADEDITADPGVWEEEGFACEAIDTAFRFDDLDEARRLLGFFFGERGRAGAALDVCFRVGLFSRRSCGPGSPAHAASRRTHEGSVGRMPDREQGPEGR
jgi:SAM-dependent methyltransferase